LQQAGYPNGGVHGGHIAAIWNQGPNGYVLSLHFTEQPHASITSWQQTVTETARAMSGISERNPPSASAPSSSCPRTVGGRSAKGVAIALGHGPAYPVLGMAAAPPAPGGVAPLSDDVHKHGLYFHKTLWAISSQAASDLLILASSYHDRRPVHFFDGRQQHRTLRLPRPKRSWEYATTTTLLPRPGCYVFQVTGRGLDQRIVFEAKLD
jgi:hypothetical protein